MDSNGTIDATKTVSDDITIGSIFGEYSATGINGSKLAMTIGIDYIPADADIDRRSITQSSLGAKAPTTVPSKSCDLLILVWVNDTDLPIIVALEYPTVPYNIVLSLTIKPGCKYNV